MCKINIRGQCAPRALLAGVLGQVTGLSNLSAHAMALGFNCAVLGEKAELWPDTQQKHSERSGLCC